MWEAFTIFAPVLAFMLIPVWIPLIGVIGGLVADIVSTRPAARA